MCILKWLYHNTGFSGIQENLYWPLILICFFNHIEQQICEYFIEMGDIIEEKVSYYNFFSNIVLGNVVHMVLVVQNIFYWIYFV